MVGRWSLVIGRLLFVVLPSPGVKLVVLVSLWDLISLTLNWHFCGYGQVVLSQPEREVQTLLILSPGKKRNPPEKKTQQRLKEVEEQVPEVNRPAPLYDVRFRTISLDPASEKLAGNQPSIRKKTEKRVARRSQPIAPPG
jgi:hypothetical protein